MYIRRPQQKCHFIVRVLVAKLHIARSDCNPAVSLRPAGLAGRFQAFCNKRLPGCAYPKKIQIL